MLKAYVRDGDCLALLPHTSPLAGADWIDLYRPQDHQAGAVAALGVDVPTLEDMEEIEISNRLYREGKSIYMTAVLPGQLPDGKLAAMPVTFILSPERLVTVRHHEPRPMVTFPTRAERGSGGIGDADRIFLGLMEEIVSRLADLLEGVGRVLDVTGLHVFGTAGTVKDSTLRVTLMKVGQEAESMARIRLGLLSIERVLSFYTATTGDRPQANELKAQAKSINRDVQALEVHADFLGNRLGMTVDATMGLINLQQNNTVRVLSVVAALFLPPTMIASIYGMNFDVMPELHWRWGYPAALAAMVASAALIYLLARWKKWL